MGIPSRGKLPEGAGGRSTAAFARLRLKALAQPTIDLTLRTHAGQITRIVESPGLSLTEPELEALVSQLRDVARKTLPQESLTYGVFSGERERMIHAIITLISDETTGQPLAFNALSMMDVELDGEPTQVTHLGLVMVDPDARGQGLSWVLYGLTALILFARDGLRAKWISNVTQVPAVCGMVSETFSDVFPSPRPDARQSFAHLQLARGIMRHHRAVFGVGAEAGFDEGRFVITNAYTGGSDALKKSFESAPKHRDNRYNDFCARELDYERGDDLLQLGRIDLPGARRYLLSEVPSRSVPALLVAAAVVALQRLALPILHWIDDTRPFGVLRPRARKPCGAAMMTFDYEAFTTRNIGFVDDREQQLLRQARVFVCGVGGMGGAAFMALVRAGIGRFVIADIDRFEMSNLNRQVFAFIDKVGQKKIDVAANAARHINPSIELEALGADWTTKLPEIARRCPIVVNGMDDIAAGVHLYRAARDAGATIIDAYMSPLPSVTVVRPSDLRPEERLGFPTIGKDWRDITDDDKRKAMLAEIEHVMLHSSSRHYVNLAIAAEVAAGRRSRMSFAPMVISTGMLMAYETISLVLGRPASADCRGWFFNPHKPAIERPHNAVVAALMRPFVRRAIARIMSGQ